MGSRANVLGVGIDSTDMDGTVKAIRAALLRREKGYICLGGVHGIMEAQRNAVLRSVFANALIVAPDGMPTVWIGRLQGFSHMRRVFGPDLMIEVMRRPEFGGYTHFLCGGDYGVAEELRDLLKIRCPQAKVVGTFTPPFRAMDKAEEVEMSERIRLARPDIVWVGLGTPKQDFFMSQYLPLVNATLMIGVGAAFLYHTGKISDSPTWVKQVGLQWLHRLMQEPSRLWKRYLLNNPKFVISIGLQMVGLKRYTLEAGVPGEKNQVETNNVRKSRSSV